MLTRRHFLTGAAAAAATVALPRQTDRYDYSRKVGRPTILRPGKTVEVALASAERRVALPCFGGKSLPLWTFQDGTWPPIIRLNYGDRLKTTLRNNLPRS